ncbi:GTP-binding protein Di-Ras1 [Hydra vulgaris]|uniref:GTP-binding protein Di-Ras1 n=1 Tax=Hydra vulgaris TaxID=6087 RepID=A0ABM4B5H6_HYDVU
MQTRRQGNAKSRRNALKTLRKRDCVGLLLVGKCETGKSSLVNRWINGDYKDYYIPTVEEFYLKSYGVMGHSVNVGVIDMSGSWDFPGMLDLYFNKADSIIFVYEVNNKVSISEMFLFYQRLVKIRGENHEVYMTVVGTKMDKQQQYDESTKNEAVDAFIKEIGGRAKHTITSAKLNINVVEAFEAALSNVVANMTPNEDAIKRLDKLMKTNEKKSICSACSLM